MAFTCILTLDGMGFADFPEAIHATVMKNLDLRSLMRLAISNKALYSTLRLSKKSWKRVVWGEKSVSVDGFSKIPVASAQLLLQKATVDKLVYQCRVAPTPIKDLNVDVLEVWKFLHDEHLPSLLASTRPTILDYRKDTHNFKQGETLVNLINESVKEISLLIIGSGTFNDILKMKCSTIRLQFINPQNSLPEGITEFVRALFHQWVSGQRDIDKIEINLGLYELSEWIWEDNALGNDFLVTSQDNGQKFGFFKRTDARDLKVTICENTVSLVSEHTC